QPPSTAAGAAGAAPGTALGAGVTGGAGLAFGAGVALVACGSLARSGAAGERANDTAVVSATAARPTSRRRPMGPPLLDAVPPALETRTVIHNQPLERLH